MRVNPTRPAQRTPEVRAHQANEQERRAENQELRREALNVLHRNPGRTTMVQFDTDDRDGWLRMMREYLRRGRNGIKDRTTNCTILKNGRITVVSYNSGQFIIYGNDENINGFTQWFEESRNRITDLDNDMARMNLEDQ